MHRLKVARRGQTRFSSVGAHLLYRTSPVGQRPTAPTSEARRVLTPLMTRTVLSTAIAGAVFALTTGTANAATDYWAAIAISPSTGNVGYTYNSASSGGAASGAVHKCGASDCQAVVRVINGCAAVAQAPDGSWGWGYAPPSAMRNTRPSPIPSPLERIYAVGRAPTMGRSVRARRDHVELLVTAGAHPLDHASSTAGSRRHGPALGGGG